MIMKDKSVIFVRDYSANKYKYFTCTCYNSDKPSHRKSERYFLYKNRPMDIFQMKWSGGNNAIGKDNAAPKNKEVISKKSSRRTRKTEIRDLLRTISREAQLRTLERSSILSVSLENRP